MQRECFKVMVGSEGERDPSIGYSSIRDKKRDTRERRHYKDEIGRAIRLLQNGKAESIHDW